MVRRKFTGTDPANHQSENTWFTPKEFLEKLGMFDLDPCTMSFRPFDIANKSYCFDLGQDGLTLPWEGHVWLNPPYGKELGPFVDKFIQHRYGIMLIFARMGSEHIQKLIKEGAYLYCLRNRVTFIDKNLIKAKSNSGCDSCLVFFNPQEIENVKKFDGVLIKGI